MWPAGKLRLAGNADDCDGSASKPMDTAKEDSAAGRTAGHVAQEANKHGAISSVSLHRKPAPAPPAQLHRGPRTGAAPVEDSCAALWCWPEICWVPVHSGSQLPGTWRSVQLACHLLAVQHYTVCQCQWPQIDLCGRCSGICAL